MPPTPWDLTFSATAGPAAVDLRIEPVDGQYDAAALHISLRNEGAESVRLDRAVATAPLDLAAASALTWTFGGSAPGIRRLDDLEEGESAISASLIVVEAPVRAASVLLAGVTAFDTYGVQVTVAVDDAGDILQSLSITFDLEGTVLAPGESLELPAVRVAQGTDATELLDEWGHGAEETMGVAAPLLGAALWRAPEGVDLPTLAGGINALVEAGYDLSTIIIPVVVEPGAPIPEAVYPLVEMVHDSGLQACLSFAPLIASADAPLLAESPSAVLRDTNGEPITVATASGDRVLLDATRAEVIAWLRSVTEQVLAMEVAELEVTGLDHAAVPGSHAAYSRAGVTARRHVREALAVLHSVAMPNLDMIAADGPSEAAAGLADLIAIDGTAPGVLADVLFLNTCQATPALTVPLDAPPAVIRRVAATAAVTACGVILTGDPRATDAASAAVLRSVLPPAGVAGALEAGDPPDLEAWRAPVDEGFSTLAIFNNSEDAEWLAVNEFVDPGEAAFDPWSGQMLDRGDVLLQPGDAAVWQIAGSTAAPQVVGDTGHVARERLNLRVVSGRLQVENEDSRPRVLAVDVRGRKLIVEMEPGEKRWFD